MVREGNPFIRIWREVHSIYKDVAEEEGLVMSDLISTILLEAAISDTPLIVYTLMEWFDIRYEKAVETADKLKEKAIAFLKAFASAKEVVKTA